MLTHLKIENFILAGDVEISFHNRFNVITGESGAGKSIIVDALGFVMGEKIPSSKFADSGQVRVQARFETDGVMPGREFLPEAVHNAISEHEEIIFSRTLYPSGRNIYCINGHIVPQKAYSLMGNMLVDIHGQGDNQELLYPEKQREMLDFLGGEKAQDLLSALGRLSGDFKAVTSEIESLENMEKEKNRQMDWLAHEISEIESAGLAPGEDEELIQRKRILENAEKIAMISGRISSILGGDGGVLERLNQVSREFSSWIAFDPALEQDRSALEQALETLQEILFRVRERGEEIDFSPMALDDLNFRLHQIDGLKRKYGNTIEEILRYVDKSRSSLENLENSAERIGALYTVRENLVEEWMGKAGELSALRRKTAGKLMKNVVLQLKDLGMEMARFSVSMEKLPDESLPTSHGMESIEFLISANPGLSEKPLRTTASGGEVSRIMLALKNIFSRFRGFSTLILDEIDAGLGGVSAEVVGEKLKQISENRQVIAITHLPVIAVMADCHFQTGKESDGSSTWINVQCLSDLNRVEEVRRMLAGEKAGVETRELAIKLLEKKQAI